MGRLGEDVVEVNAVGDVLYEGLCLTPQLGGLNHLVGHHSLFHFPCFAVDLGFTGRVNQGLQYNVCNKIYSNKIKVPYSTVKKECILK